MAIWANILLQDYHPRCALRGEKAKDRVVRFHVLASEIALGKSIFPIYSPCIPHYSPVEPLHLPCQDDGADSDSEAGSMEPIVTHSDHESDSFPQHEMSKDLELEVQSATKETDGHKTCHKTCHKAQ
jgi:hypothetical protein